MQAFAVLRYECYLGNLKNQFLTYFHSSFHMDNMKHLEIFDIIHTFTDSDSNKN